MNSFYSDNDKKIITKGLFGTTAETIAKGFVNDKGKEKYYVSTSQMRRLFDEVKHYDQKLKDKPDTWKEVEPYIDMIMSKISYNVARAKERKKTEADVYDNLYNFFKEWLRKVKDEKDYHAFSSLFEAVYGYYYENYLKVKSEKEKK